MSLRNYLKIKNFKLKIALFIFLIMLIPTHYTFADITTGLVGHWTFDEGMGTTAGDSSGSGNDGTLTHTNITNRHSSFIRYIV